jgi:hypothetical protein
MRASKRSAAPEPVEVSQDELRSALELLKSEQAAGAATDFPLLLVEAARSIGYSIGLVSLPLAIATMPLDARWGVGLIVASIVAFSATTLLPKTTLRDAVQAARDAVDPGTVKAAMDLREHRRHHQGLLAVPLLMLVPLLFGGGFALIAWRAITDGEVSLLGVGLVELSPLVVFGWNAWDSYQDYRYFTRVSRTRGRLERLAAAPTPEDGTVAIEPSEVRVLAHAETKKIQRTVDAAVASLPNVLDSAWSVSIEPAAQESLERLAEENPADWGRVVSAIGSLQSAPMPPDAKPVDVTGLKYRLDEDAQRVYVLEVDREAVSDA